MHIEHQVSVLLQKSSFLGTAQPILLTLLTVTEESLLFDTMI